MSVVINQAALAELYRSEDGAVSRSLVAIAQAVETEAKSLAPVRTGKLRDSITHRLERDGDELAAIVGSPVPYASVVEMGTVHASAQPFLTPAATSITGADIKAITRLRDGTTR